MKSLVKVNEFNRPETMFKDFFDSFLGSDFDTFYSNGRPAANIFHNKAGFGIELSIPGYDKADVQIDIEGRHLLIQSVEVEDKAASDSDNMSYVRRDFTKRPFKMKYTLPKVADVNGLTAKLEHGILNIYVPKVEEALPKQIKVEIA